MANIEFGANTLAFIWSMDAAEAIRQLGDLGFRQFDVIVTPPHLDPYRTDAATRKRLQQALDAIGGRIVALNVPSLDQNLASPSRETLDFSVELYRASLDLAADFGIPDVVVLTGRTHSLVAAPREMLMSSFRGAFERILRHSQQAKVGLMIENHPLGVLPQAQQISSFLRDGGYSDVGILYDVANGTWVGEDPCKVLTDIWPLLKMVHLSDAPRGQWRHDPIGSGDIDFRALADLFRDRTPAFPVVIEIVGDNALAQFADGLGRLAAAGWRNP